MIATTDHSGVAVLVFLIVGVGAVAWLHWLYQRDKALTDDQERAERDRMRRHLARWYPAEDEPTRPHRPMTTTGRRRRGHANGRPS